MNIRIFYDDIKFRLSGSEKIKKFLHRVIIEENKIPGDLKFIFTNDKNLLEINKSFLGHDYFTDVITFGDNEGSVINGEVYISIDTVRINAVKFKTGTINEIIRVMVHGVLHLCGYNDESGKDRDIMLKRQEDVVKNFEGVN